MGQSLTLGEQLRLPIVVKIEHVEKNKRKRFSGAHQGYAIFLMSFISGIDQRD